MRTFCARTDPRVVSIKRTICVGLVERQTYPFGNVIFYTYWDMFLVWHQNVLRGMG